MIQVLRIMLSYLSIHFGFLPNLNIGFNSDLFIYLFWYLLCIGYLDYTMSSHRGWHSICSSKISLFINQDVDCLGIPETEVG